MARRGRSIGTVEDAYVPVPFKEIFQSNLHREKAFEAAEDDITDIETLLGTSGGTAGDQAYARDLGEAFTSEFQKALENTGGNLIQTSSFLRNQLGKITQATSYLDANREAKQKFYTEIDKANLDPAVAQYLKLQSDKDFDARGGSRERASYSGMPYVDLNAKEVRDQLLDLAAKVPEHVDIEGVYDWYNGYGQNIFDIQRGVKSRQQLVKEGKMKPEALQEYMENLPSNWDQPDLNINGGQPIFSMEKTKQKNKNKIFNEIAALAGEDPRLWAYFQQGSDANNSMFPDKPTKPETGFNTMLEGVANLVDIPEQLVTKSFPDMSVDTDSSDDDEDQGKVPSSYKATTPPITQYPMFDNLTTTSSADMRNEIMNMPPDVMTDADKYFYDSLINVARKGTNEGKEIDFTNELRTVANTPSDFASGSGRNYGPLFEEYFLKEDGSVNMERIDFPWYTLNPNAWITDAIKDKTGSWTEKEQLRNDVIRLRNRLGSAYNDLLDNIGTEQKSFADNIENMRNKIDQQVELLTVDDTKAGKENTLALNILTDSNLNKGGVFKEEGNNKFEKIENIGALTNALISGIEKYPVKIDGEEYRGIQIKAKGTGTNAAVKTYRVRIPEAQYQTSLVNSGVMKDFNPNYEEYKGVDKDQIRNIAQAPDGARVVLPQTEAIFNEKLDMYLNEVGITATDREFKAFIERKSGVEPYNLQIGVRIGSENNQFTFVNDEYRFSTEQAAGNAITNIVDAILEDYHTFLNKK